MAESPATQPPLEVVGGVVVDDRGRVLLTQRPEGREYAGLWEFPGGKIEPGETPGQALSRELHEELGITAEPGDRLVTVPLATGRRRIRLDVHRIRSWEGEVQSLDGQALAWVAVDRLADYPMPPADRPVVAALRNPDRMLVTPPPGAGDPDDADAGWAIALAAALAGGVRWVQVRLPGVAPGRARALAATAVQLGDAAGARVMVNVAALVDERTRTGAVDGREAGIAGTGDAIDFAAAHGIGLHFPAHLLARWSGARPVPADLLFAASCHDVDELRRAEAAGCDVAVVGPVAATRSHPGAAGIGWDGFAALREQSALPMFAIGGLGPADIPDARRHGAQGIAAITALWPGGR